MSYTKHKRRTLIQRVQDGIIRRPGLYSIITFVLISSLIFLLINGQYQRLENRNHARDREVLEAVKNRLQSALNQSLSATQSLSFLVSKNGLTANFDSAAASLLSYNHYIDALQLVPGGVIKYIYPLEGNEAVLNYDILKDPERNKEAYKAIQLRKLFFAGPFSLRQGGIGVVGRLPVFVENKFWGFSAVVIKLQTLLNSAGIDTGWVSGYKFQLSKINAETGKEEYFLPLHSKPLEKSVSVMVPDGEWKLSVVSETSRSIISEIFPLIILGILFTILFAWFIWIILKRPAELQKIVALKTAEVEESSKRNHAIVGAIPDTIFIMDGLGNFIDYSNSFGNPLLVSPDQFIGRNVKEVMPSSLAEEIIVNIRKVLKDNKPFTSSYELGMNSEKGFYESTYSKIGENEVMTIVRDVTPRVKAEMLSRQNEEKLRYVLTSSADDFYVIDKSFCITLINQWAEENLSKAWGNKVTIGVNVLDLVPKDQREKIFENFKKVFDGKKIEYEVERIENGNKFWVQVNYMPVYDKKNDITGAIVVTRDITERKLAEEEIRRINNRFEMISRTTNDAVWEWDLGSGKLWCNEVHQQLYGLTMDDPVPSEKMWADRIHPEDRDKVVQMQARILASDKNVFISEYRFYTEKEGYRNLYDRCYIVRDENGKPVRMMGSMMDITERKRVESELIDSEKKYRGLVENAPEALVVFDIELRRFVSVSESAVKFFGIPREELEKIGPADISPEYQPDGRLSTEAAMDNVNRTIAGEKISFEWIHCDHEKNPITCEVRLVRLPSEKSILIRGSIVDIGERKKAERKLQESEEKYRTFFENSLDGIMLTVPDGRILSANPAACHMFGMSEDEIIQAGRRELVDSTDESLSVLLEERRLKGKASGELTLIRKNGSKFPAEVTSATFIDAFGNERTSMIIRDITERKRAEEEIMKTNARFGIVSKATSDIVWDWDLATNTLWWNDNYYSNLGYTKKDEIVHIEEWYSHIHPADVNKVRAKVKKAISGKSNTWRDEYNYEKADGGYLNFLDRGYIIRNQSGVAVRMIGSMVDMTPVYNAQKELAESENRLRTILDTDPECIKLMGPGCELYEINKAGLEMLESDDFEKIKGHSILSVVAEAQRSRAEQLVTDAFRGISGKMEFEMLTFRGKKRWCEISIVPFKNAEGEIIYALGVTIDITEKRKAEIELKQSEERYRTLVEQAVDAIALYDEKGKVLDVNSGASELLGYSKEELSKMYLHEILLEDEINDNPVRYDILEKGHSTVKQRRMKRKDGTVVITEVRSQQLPDGRFLSVVRDLTERIQTEQELSESYKAVRKLTAHLQKIREEERSNIAREIHDELGQQLTVMKMDVSWVNKKITEGEGAIKERLQGLLHMLDDTVKSVRRISSELRPSLLDDLGLIAAMEWQLNEFEKRSGIKTSFSAPDDEVNLSNDVKTALFRIFQESLTNVARHSEANSLSVSFVQNNGDLILAIADNGKGFDKQAISERRTLGILGMNERSMMIGASYEIISEPGQGTKVSIRVPVKQIE